MTRFHDMLYSPALPHWFCDTIFPVRLLFFRVRGLNAHRRWYVYTLAANANEWSYCLQTNSDVKFGRNLVLSCKILIYINFATFSIIRLSSIPFFFTARIRGKGFHITTSYQMVTRFAESQTIFVTCSNSAESEWMVTMNVRSHSAYRLHLYLGTFRCTEFTFVRVRRRNVDAP